MIFYYCVINGLVSRLEHWHQRETFENITHCLVVFSLPDFGPYRNSSGLLHLDFQFVQDKFAQFYSMSWCSHVTVPIHILKSEFDTDHYITAVPHLLVFNWLISNTLIMILSRFGGKSFVKIISPPEKNRLEYVPGRGVGERQASWGVEDTPCCAQLQSGSGTATLPPAAAQPRPIKDLWCAPALDKNTPGFHKLWKYPALSSALASPSSHHPSGQ